MFSEDKIDVLFMFSHDRGNGCLLFFDNSAHGSSPLNPEILVSPEERRKI